MWIVKNTLRGALKFPGLEITIPPDSEFDLDVLDREISENSNQIKVAFEEGYLENIRKEAPPEEEKEEEEERKGEKRGITDEELERTLTRFKNNIIEEIKGSLPPVDKSTEQGSTLVEKLSQLRDSFAGDVKDLAQSVEQIKERIRQEKHRILDDQKLSNAELRARLKFLEEKEEEISNNFERLGTRSTSQSGSDDDEGNGLLEKADLLSDL